MALNNENSPESRFDSIDCVNRTGFREKAAKDRLVSAISCIPELLMPQTCNVCGCEDAQAICHSCFEQHFIPFRVICNKCGRQRVSEIAGDDCALCHNTDMRFRQARSLFSYADTARRIFLKAKFNDRRYALAKSLCHQVVSLWMSEAASHLHFTDAPAKFDYVVEIPIIRPMGFGERFRGLISMQMPPKPVNRRNFNFSRILAQTLASGLDTRWHYDTLLKVKDIPSQIGLGESERRRNVKDAFTVSPGFRDKLKGKYVLLVDDLLTTGATVSECAKILRRARAKSVYVLTMFSTSPTFVPERSVLDDEGLFDELYIPDALL